MTIIWPASLETQCYPTSVTTALYLQSDKSLPIFPCLPSSLSPLASSPGLLSACETKKPLSRGILHSESHKWHQLKSGVPIGEAFRATLINFI